MEVSKACDTQLRQNIARTWEEFNAHREDDFADLIQRMETV